MCYGKKDQKESFFVGLDGSMGSWLGLRKLVTDTCNDITKKKPVAWWLEELEKASVGCSPIKNLKAALFCHIFFAQ